MGFGAGITRVEVFTVSQPVRVAAGPSVAEYHSRSSVIVRLADSDGHIGWGETYLRVGTAANLAEAAGLLIGESPSAARDLSVRLGGAMPDRYAVSALAIAIDDLRGQQLGVSVADLYGGGHRARVRAYASSGGYRSDAEPEETWIEEVGTAISEGFTACKIRIGRYAPVREIAILERVRDLAGPDIDLMVDGNGAYSVPTAISMGRALERLQFRWFEEPLIRFRSGLCYPGYEQLTTLDIAIAAGEGLQDRSSFNAFLTRNAADIVQPDVAICGGIGEALFVAELAALTGRTCVPHAWGGPIQLAATLQLLALLPEPSELVGPDSPLLELDRFENPLHAQLCPGQLEQMNGWVSIPAGPGLGITVDEPSFRGSALCIASFNATDTAGS